MDIVFINHDAGIHAQTFSPVPARPVQRRLPRGLGGKGKRIHICGIIIDDETPCGKAYTRAEHLRRHQLSHTQPLNMQHLRQKEQLDFNLPSPDRQTFEFSPQSLTLLPPSCPLTQNIGQRSYDELELMHHHVTFLDSVYLIEGLLKGEKPTWDDVRTWWLRKVVKPTEWTDDAKDMVLSISSAHMATLRRNERFDSRSMTHYTKALVLHRQRVQSLIDGVEANVAALESILFHSFSLTIRSKVAMIESGNGLQALADVLAWFNMCRGHARLTTWLLTSSVLELFMSTSFYTEVVCGYEKSAGSMLHFVRYVDKQPKLSLFDSLFNALKRNVEDSRVVDECWHIVKWTEWIYLHFSAGRIETVSFEVYMQAAYSVPPSFIDLLFQRNPAALVILLHFLCVEKHPLFEDTWWTHRGVEQRVELIANLLPPDWGWGAEWPLAVVRGQFQIHEYPTWAKRKGFPVSNLFDEMELSSAAESLL